jgi:hypothetical protein
MDAASLGVTDVVMHSLAIGKPVALSTFRRILAGQVPRSSRIRGNLAATLSAPDKDRVLTAAQLFGEQPLPRWAQDDVYGVAA